MIRSYWASASGDNWMVVSEGAAMVSRERRDERDVEMQSQRKNQNVATQDLERKPNSDCSMRIFWPNIFHLQVSSQNIGH